MTPTRPSILLVEDEPAHAEAIRRAFHSGAPEYEVRVADSLRGFRDEVAARPPTLALLDLNLPDGRAVDALVSPPEAGPCPILVMTSHGDEATAVAALRAGALDYVVKSPESFASMPQSAARALREWEVRGERKRAQEALKENQARLNSTLRATNVGLWEWDARSNRCQYSAEWKAQLGYQEQELGDSFDEFLPRLHPNDRRRVERAIRDYLAQPDSDWDLEFRLRHRDGSYRWILSRASPIRDDHGQLTHVRGCHIDLTERRKAEEALSQSESRFRSLYEQAPIGIWEEDLSAVQARFAAWRAGGVTDWPAFFAQRPEAVRECAALVRVLDANQTSAHMMGEQCKEHLITSLPQCFTEESYRVFGDELAVLAGGGTHFEGEVPVRLRNGKELRLLLSLSVVTGHEATLNRVLVSFVDVTARAHTEAALQSSQAELTAVYENAPVMMLLLDEERRVVRVNRAAREFTGRSEAELLGCLSGGVLGCLRALDDPRGCGYGSDCTLCPLRQAIHDTQTTGRTHQGVEVQPKLVQGQETREFWANVSTAQVTVAGQRRVLLCIEDITARKRALRERTTLATALESSVNEIYLFDAATLGFRYANQAALRNLGYSLEQLRGLTPVDLKPDHTRESFERLLGPLRRREERSLTFTTRHRRADGSCYPAEVLLQHLEQEGDAFFLAVIQDISQRQRLEAQFRQAQKMEAIGQLVGGVAHDFNNILAAVMLHLDALQTEPGLGKETRADLKELAAEAKRGATLTRQLLMYSRRSVLQVKSVDLNELIENLLKMLRRLLGEHIDLRFHGKIGLPRIDADPGMLEQVVVNLAVNGRDAMPEGGPLTLSTSAGAFDEAQARLHPDRRAGRFVCLAVADGGCGMNEATLNRIFEPFFTTKDVGKGTGLGLATVQGIAAQHKGWVEVESQPGKGSTFRVFLPESTLTTAKPSATVDNQPPPRGDETILLVEDEASLRRTVSACLHSLGYQVLEAANGLEAMALWSLHQREIDLVLTDLVMPEGLSGLQLAQRLRRAQPGLKIIIASGYSAELAEKGLSPADRFSFLPKPFDVATLGRTVRACLDRP